MTMPATKTLFRLLPQVYVGRMVSFGGCEVELFLTDEHNLRRTDVVVADIAQLDERIAVLSFSDLMRKLLGFADAEYHVIAVHRLILRGREQDPTYFVSSRVGLERLRKHMGIPSDKNDHVEPFERLKHVFAKGELEEWK